MPSFGYLETSLVYMFIVCVCVSGHGRPRLAPGAGDHDGARARLRAPPGTVGPARAPLVRKHYR